MKTHIAFLGLGLGFLLALGGCRAKRHDSATYRQDYAMSQERGEACVHSSARFDSLIDLGHWQWDSVTYFLRYDSVNRPMVTVTAKKASLHKTTVAASSVSEHISDTSFIHIRADTETISESLTHSVTDYSPQWLRRLAVTAAIAILMVLLWRKLIKR